jgi:predicted ATPase/signal transduction histidine kinase
LERCLHQLGIAGRIDPFALGTSDVPERFQIPQKLYGREGELATLLGLFDAMAATGRPQLSLVAGYPGIGKSSLVHELLRPVVRERGYFLSGKFDQAKRDAPYAALAQAFRELVQEILTEGDEGIAAWRRRLTEALGVNGKLILDIVPQLEMVIGPQPAVPELPPNEAQNRLKFVFERFVAACAGRPHPLVLFLDDLQWADPASLQLIQHVITHPDTHHFLMVGAYRDNEVGPEHPLLATVGQIARAGAPVHTITIPPLSRPDLRRFVADTIHCAPERADPLTQLVHERTEGNPFFLIHFLRSLYQEGLIGQDPQTGDWTWAEARIAARGYEDNVLDLMVGKLRRLAGPTRETLKWAACLGSQVPLHALATVCQLPVAAIEETLGEAVRERLVALSETTVRFAHDRVQQAAWALMTDDERCACHLSIGRRLLADTPAEHCEEAIFDIVDHLNQGVALIEEPREREVLFGLDLLAGKKAKASVAHAAARRYLAQALELLPADGWNARYEETLSLHLELAECEWLVGNLPRATELHEVILARGRSHLDRARAYRLRLMLYQAAGQYEDSIAVALEALGLLGLQFPCTEAEIAAAFAAENAAIDANLRGRPVAALIDAPVAHDPAVSAAMGLLSDFLSSAYVARPALFPLVAVRTVNHSLEHGNVPESCGGYSAYGMILASVFGDFGRAAEFSEMSLRLNEKLGDTRLRGMLLFLHGNFINCWRRHLSTSRPLMEKGFAASLDVGDLVYAGFTAHNMVWQAVERGVPLEEVAELARRYAAFARQNHLPLIHELIRGYGQLAKCLAGGTAGPIDFDDDTFSERACFATFASASFLAGSISLCVAKLLAAVVMGREREALALAEQGAPWLAAASCKTNVATYHFCHALALAALHPGDDAARAPLPLIAEKAQKLARWAESCPENFRGAHALVAAELARIEGRPLDAEGLYEDAIRSAREHGFVQTEALASERAARFCRSRDLDTAADAHLRNARDCYLRWGAGGKVRQLETRHPELAAHRELIDPSTVSTRSERLDFSTAVKASQAISSQILLDRLLETLMRVVLESAGAQRGWLLLPEGKTLAVAAEANVQGQDVCVRLRPPRERVVLPWSVIGYAHLSRETVLLADASARGPFADDEYLARDWAKSILCLPILRQAQPIGVLYLENDLVTDAFTADRLAVLELLAAQVAISLENALLLAKEKEARAAAEAAERRSAFLAHELKTPLATARMRMSALTMMASQQVMIPTASLSPTLVALDRQFSRLGALVESLLESARVQTGQLALAREELDLVAVVRDVLDLVAEQAESAGCLLQVEAPGPVRGNWDRLRLEQVATNLLTNAFKYGAGKPVRVTVRRVGTLARLSVSDQGIGIPPADQAHIFEPFGRATSLHRQQSLGLGLYLVREIVRAHGGRVDLSSEPGAGTTFTVELPVN